MLPSLDSLTAAGQRHTMGKIVRFVSEEIECLDRSVTPRDRWTLLECLAGLIREAGRLSPDPERFCRRAETALDLLSSRL